MKKKTMKDPPSLGGQSPKTGRAVNAVAPASSNVGDWTLKFTQSASKQLANLHEFEQSLSKQSIDSLSKQ